MCIDPTIFSAVFDGAIVRDVVVGALLGLALMNLAAYLDNHNQLRRSRTLRRYREDVYQLRQKAAQARKIAADECLQDVYRLTRKR